MHLQFFRDGKKPWSLLARLLSGRLRTWRWNQSHGHKLKSFPEKQSSISSSSEVSQTLPTLNDMESELSVTVENAAGSVRILTMKNEGHVHNLVDTGDYDRIKKEAKGEFEKSRINRAHLKMLVREGFRNRRIEVKKLEEDSEPMISSIISSWPCMQHGDYVSLLIYTLKNITIV